MFREDTTDGEISVCVERREGWAMGIENRWLSDKTIKDKDIKKSSYNTFLLVPHTLVNSNRNRKSYQEDPR